MPQPRRGGIGKSFILFYFLMFHLRLSVSIPQGGEKGKIKAKGKRKGKGKVNS